MGGVAPEDPRPGPHLGTDAAGASQHSANRDQAAAGTAVDLVDGAVVGNDDIWRTVADGLQGADVGELLRQSRYRRLRRGMGSNLNWEGKVQQADQEPDRLGGAFHVGSPLLPTTSSFWRFTRTGALVEEGSPDEGGSPPAWLYWGGSRRVHADLAALLHPCVPMTPIDRDSVPPTDSGPLFDNRTDSGHALRLKRAWDMTCVPC